MPVVTWEEEYGWRKMAFDLLWRMEEGNSMDDFLRARSMMVPGVAGATTTLITGSLASQFGLPGNWTALTVSLLLGLLVWADKNVPVWQRFSFYIVNSMIIFSVAVGFNTAAAAAFESPEVLGGRTRGAISEPVNEKPFFHEWF